MVEEGVKNLEKSVDIYKILQNINEVKNRKGQEVAHCFVQGVKLACEISTLI